MTLIPSRTVALWGAVASVGLASLVMGMTLFWGFVTLAVTVGLGAALLNMPVAWFAIRFMANESGATRVTIAGSVIVGILNVLIASSITTAISGENWIMESVFPDLMQSWASSLILGAPPGLVFGALFVLPVRHVHRLHRNGAVEAGDKALRICGGWLLLISLGCLALDLVNVPDVVAVMAWRPYLLAVVASAAASGALAAAVAHLRIARRRSWFERVQDGSEPGWTIVPRSRVAEGLEGLPTLFVSTANCNVVLVQHETVESGGAYRTASNLVPRAMVHLPEGLADMSFFLPNDEQRASLERSPL